MHVCWSPFAVEYEKLFLILRRELDPWNIAFIDLAMFADDLVRPL